MKWFLSYVILYFIEPFILIRISVTDEDCAAVEIDLKSIIKN